MPEDGKWYQDWDEDEEKMVMMTDDTYYCSYLFPTMMAATTAVIALTIPGTITNHHHRYQGSRGLLKSFASSEGVNTITSGAEVSSVRRGSGRLSCGRVHMAVWQ